jgi:hypothetical protein
VLLGAICGIWILIGAYRLTEARKKKKGRN